MNSPSSRTLSRRRSIAAGLGAAGALLVACGPRDAPIGTAPSAGAPPASGAPTGGGPATIAYWRPVRGKGEESATAQITEAYSKANPSVGFTVEYIPDDALLQKYQSGLATNTGPDILTLNTEWPAVYAGIGAVADPPGELQTFIKENTYPAVQEVASYKGRFVAVPIDSSNLVVGYNVKLLREAGVDPSTPPADWKELGDLAAKLTKRDASGRLVQAGLETFRAWTDEWTWNTWLGAAGGRRWRSLDALDYLEPPFVAAVELLADWLHGRKINDVAAIPDAFVHGKAALIMAGPWTITGTAQDAPDLEWGSWLVPPQQAGGRTGTTLGGWHLAANAKSKKLDAVWPFLTYHVRPANKVLWYKLSARTPAWTDVADDPLFRSDPNRATMVRQQGGHVGVGQPSSPAYLDVRDNVTTVLERVLENREDARKVLTEEKAKVEPIFRQKSKA
jgi:multiple sugar transport system substrate-binding protein